MDTGGVYDATLDALPVIQPTLKPTILVLNFVRGFIHFVQGSNFYLCGKYSPVCRFLVNHLTKIGIIILISVYNSTIHFCSLNVTYTCRYCDRLWSESAGSGSPRTVTKDQRQEGNLRPNPAKST